MVSKALEAADKLASQGIDCRVAQVVAREKPVPMGFIGIKDVYAKSGKPDELLQRYGLTAEAIEQAVKAVIGKKLR
jgi:transketolase